MDWLKTAGAVFLTWPVLIFPFTPHVTCHNDQLTAGGATPPSPPVSSKITAAMSRGAPK